MLQGPLATISIAKQWYFTVAMALSVSLHIVLFIELKTAKVVTRYQQPKISKSMMVSFQSDMLAENDNPIAEKESDSKSFAKKNTEVLLPKNTEDIQIKKTKSRAVNDNPEVALMELKDSKPESSLLYSLTDLSEESRFRLTRETCTEKQLASKIFTCDDTKPWRLQEVNYFDKAFADAFGSRSIAKSFRDDMNRISELIKQKEGVSRLEPGGNEIMLQEQARIEIEIENIDEKYNKDVNLLEVIGEGGRGIKELFR